MVYSLVTTSWRAERVLPPYVDHQVSFQEPMLLDRALNLFSFVWGGLQIFVKGMERDSEGENRHTISSITRVDGSSRLWG